MYELSATNYRFPYSFLAKFINSNFIWNLDKGKAIPLQTWTVPEVSRTLRLPDFKIIGT
jgi:hypothetical protein